MSIPIYEINNILVRWASNEFPIHDFTVSNVLNAAGLDDSFFDEVFRFLMSKSGYELIPKLMLLCPENHKGETFPLSDNIEIDQEEVFDCWCGAEYQYDPHQVFVVFDFVDEFKTEVKKKSLNNQQLQHN